MTPTAVVTGAGSGVGRAVVLELVKRNYRVALIGRREQPLRETIALAPAKSDLVPIVCDIANESQVAAMADQVRRAFGDDPLVLVNSAGTNIPRRALADLSVDDYRQVIDINLTGAFLCTHAFLAGMRRRGRGTIVHVISDAGASANPVSGAAYIASKFGLVGLTATINTEERRNGIRACALLPGEIDTPLLDRRPVPPTPEARARMLQVEDVAACAMLAIDLPERATIETLVVRPREASW